MSKEETTALATYVPTIDLPLLLDPETVSEIVRENLEGMGRLKLTKISVPGAGGLSFTVQDEETGQEAAVSKIVGVLISKAPFKIWYEKSFEEKDPKNPDEQGGSCFSADTIHGTGCPSAGIPEGQLCETCPHNQWGSSRRPGSRGKDCADKIRIYILREGTTLPAYIDMPPTTIGAFRDYIQRLTVRAKPYYGVTTQIGLEADRSDAGIKYSKLTFAKLADLTKEERKQVKSYMESMADAITRVSHESAAEEPSDQTVDVTAESKDAPQLF